MPASSGWTGSAGPAGVTCPASNRIVNPGESIQTAVTAAGAGAWICVKRGQYRLSASIRPLSGQTITFEAGTVLNGSRSLTTFQREGAYWTATGQTQDFSTAAWLAPYKCPLDPTDCIYEDFFFDDRPLTHVLTLAELGPGEVFLDKAADKVYLADDPTGHKVEATNTTVGLVSEASGITIRGGTFEKFAWFGMRAAGPQWTIERNEFRYAHATGLGLIGNGHRVRNNYIHHNGNTGMTAIEGQGLVFAENHISYNNYLGFGPKPTPWHEGGVKILNTSDVLVTGNYSHHNDGDGWWFDTDNIRILVEDNIFSENTRYGFFYEVSWDAEIRNNIFRGNGTDKSWRGSGMRVATSTNVEIHHNRFEDNRHTTFFVNSMDRGSGRLGTFEMKNMNVHDNLFVMKEGWVGSSWGDGKTSGSASNNRFDRNTYVVPDTAKSWWIWEPLGFMNWDKWRSLGMEPNGTLTKG